MDPELRVGNSCELIGPKILVELIMHLDHAHIFFFNNIEKHTNALDKI